MDRFLKTIFAVSICVAVFAACNKNGGGAKVNSPRGGQANKPGATKNQPGSTPTQKEEDRSKQTPQQKAESDRMATDIKELRPLFRDAQDLIKQIWPVLIKPDAEKSGSDNIFGLMSHALQSKYSVKGYKLDKTELDKAGCTKGETELKKISEYEYDLKYAPCDNKTNLNAIARITRGSDNAWKIEFSRAGNLDAKPELMMGTLMKIWNADVKPVCNLKKLKHGRLGILECASIGQDIAADKYMIMDEIKFEHPMNDISHKVEEPLHIAWTRYKVTGTSAPEKESSGTAVDQIKNGEIKIDAYEAKLLSEVPPEIEDATRAKLAAELKQDREAQEGKNADGTKKENEGTSEKKVESLNAGAGTAAGIVQQNVDQQQDQQTQQLQQQDGQQQQQPQQAPPAAGT